MAFLPDLPALAARHGRAVLLTADGEFVPVGPGTLADALGAAAPLLVHAPGTLARLGAAPVPALDLLELFAFVLPARPAAPTPTGLARALDLPLPASLEDEAALLPDIAETLLARLAHGRDLPANREAAPLAALMGRAGWGWAPLVLAALGAPDAAPEPAALRLWARYPEWEDEAPRPQPGSLPVPPAEARAQLARMLGADAEQRPSQADYASAAASAFAPRDEPGAPIAVLAEAGTGTGKTLGYLAPASLWADRNLGAVWVSTFTRHLQRQIEAEAARLPARSPARWRVVLRKGRENYLCLLNFEDAVNARRNVPALGLIARWAMASGDGDLMGGDLPGWISELFGNFFLAGLADRRGECIHAACPHWRRCTIEHVIRRARHADIVIANHALVMAQAVWGGLDDASVPTRYVFDEGHHIFDAADSAFAAELSGAEMAELRRWLLGPEGGQRTRGRGLKRRLDDLAADEPVRAGLDAVLLAARALPAPGWEGRLAGERAADGAAPNAGESFLAALRAQALARAPDERLPLEADALPAAPETVDAAAYLDAALTRLAAPLDALRTALLDLAEREADMMEEKERLRLEALARGLKRRALDRLASWRDALRRVHDGPPAPGARPDRILTLRLDRDAALQAHLLDPTEAFATAVAGQAHGMLITSATLRDDAGQDTLAGWDGAEARTGAAHLARPAIRAEFASPFDFARQTRIFLIRDVMPNDDRALAAAFRALFEASGGGGLGLFTAIARLRAVHARIAPALEAGGIPLYAQHVDAMDNRTLIDIFREEEHSCLLGTDAMRDGVDVPGNALRLVVFERTPWPRPDILHRTRRAHLSGGAPKDYDDAIVRLRLRQAFGRLIRRDTDRGCFALLDRAAPTRLLTAFPREAPVLRCGLAEAAGAIRAFFGEGGGA